jgi:ribosomal protein S18 acetylase RimI-like enzyme
MEDVTIKIGRPEEDQAFSELVIFSGPELLPALFGSNAQNFWKVAFCHPSCCFSFEHTRFIEVKGEIAGMALTYDHTIKKKEGLRSALIVLRHLKWTFFRQIPCLRQSGEIMAQTTEGDCYLSNLAMYPNYRSLGCGAKLLDAVEEEAKKAGAKRMVADVENDNERGIQFYERIGYRIETESPILKTRDRDFQFFKISKEL